MARKEYRVDMKDARGRKSFTLANATDEKDAQRQAEKHHAHGDKPKTVTGVKPTGR